MARVSRRGLQLRLSSAAFIVSATLRQRDRDPGYGVSVQVRRLPGSAREVETQWSEDFDRALQRAACAVAARILPETRSCHLMPWSDWRGRIIPVSLFRDYQRAKQMVNERRYDEALHLYDRALSQDANNIALRYDVGQLYERLRLYPDALHTYLTLVNQIFPAPAGDGHNDTVRSSLPESWPDRKRDPFVIRYRYVVALSAGPVLVDELLSPDWPLLHSWVSRPVVEQPSDERPWRATELREVGRLLGNELRSLFPTLNAESFHEGTDLFDASAGCDEARKRALETYLLKCAEKEAKALQVDFAKDNGKILSRRRRRRPLSSLTMTSIRQTSLIISYRLHRLNARDTELSPTISQDRELVLANSPGSASQPILQHVPGELDKLRKDLRVAGYVGSESSSWLEHYNAACVYALPLTLKAARATPDRDYAHAAVAALQRALRCGEDVDFARAKKYWLQAGDPDLTGLREHECFRAFEARVYGRPLPAFVSIAKYELYYYLRRGLRRAAERLGSEWIERVSAACMYTTCQDFERWWWQERRAWYQIKRLGLFYRQWQTRYAVSTVLRSWLVMSGEDSRSLSYPDLVRPPYAWDASNEDATRETLLATERMFAVLGLSDGTGTNLTDAVSGLYDKTAQWADYARSCSRQRQVHVPEDMRQEYYGRAAVWVALRQWAEYPSEESGVAFAETAGRLSHPPSVDS